MSIGLFLMTCAFAAAVLVAVRLAMSATRLRRKNDDLTGANTRLRRENAELQATIAALEATDAEVTELPVAEGRAA